MATFAYKISVGKGHRDRAVPIIHGLRNQHVQMRYEVLTGWKRRRVALIKFSTSQCDMPDRSSAMNSRENIEIWDLGLSVISDVRLTGC